MVAPLDLDALARKRFADVEELLCTWLRGAFTTLGVTVSTGLPQGDELAEALTEQAPYYIAVEAFGGADHTPATDTASIDVDVLAVSDLDGNPDRGGASDVAELVRAALLFELPGYDNGHATVSDVVTFSRPTARPYDDNEHVIRFSAAYQVTVKSHN